MNLYDLSRHFFAKSWIGIRQKLKPPAPCAYSPRSEYHAANAFWLEQGGCLSYRQETTKLNVFSSRIQCDCAQRAPDPIFLWQTVSIFSFCSSEQCRVALFFADWIPHPQDLLKRLPHNTIHEEGLWAAQWHLALAEAWEMNVDRIPWINRASRIRSMLRNMCEH